jgi:hypothetical protein
LVLAIVFVSLCALPFLAFAQNKPEDIPQDVIDQGRDVVIVHQGTCERPGKVEVQCIVGLHVSGTYGLMLIGNEHGVVVQVIRLEGDSERILWTHSGARH